MEKIDLFNKIERDVIEKISFDRYSLEKLEEDSDNYNKESEMLDSRIYNLEETTVKYILSVAKGCFYGSKDSVDILKKYGIEPVKLNESYDLRFLEKYLNFVFNYTGCPGVLPSIDDINSELSFFGFTSDTDSKKFSSLYYALKKCDTPLFFEMYQIGLDKGLSNKEIFGRFSHIFKGLEYYNYTPQMNHLVSYVPYLDCEIDDYFGSIYKGFSMSKK